MRRTIIILSSFVTFLISSNVKCQQIDFKWELCQENFGHCYFINVLSQESNCQISIKVTAPYPTPKEFDSTKVYNYSTVTQLEKVDCDSLYSFLENYTFQNKSVGGGSRIIAKEYFETQLLPNETQVVVNGDTIRKESLWAFGYFFDKDSNKCYRQSIGYYYVIDGHNYKGEYSSNTIKKSFNIHCSNVNYEDKELLRKIYNMIKKYGNGLDSFEISLLKEMLHIDRKIN